MFSLEFYELIHYTSFNISLINGNYELFFKKERKQVLLILVCLRDYCIISELSWRNQSFHSKVLEKYFFAKISF